MANIVISGGTGLIGTALASILLQRGERVFILTTKRNPVLKLPQLSYVHWNPEKKWISPEFNLTDCRIINLAGAGVADGRWTLARKKEIADSRYQSLQTLFAAVQGGQLRATQLVSVSAIGYYADSNQKLIENDKPGNGFLSEVCVQWELEAAKFRNLSIPVAIARMGIVMSKEGGALREFLNSLQFGLAAIPGRGSQMMSWIHIEDACRLLIFLLDHQLNDVYNAVAPHPVSVNEIFEQLLKMKKGLKLKLHIHSAILKIVLGEMAEEVLRSSNVSSEKIENAGFQFKYESIKKALENL